MLIQIHHTGSSLGLSDCSVQQHCLTMQAALHIGLHFLGPHGCKSTLWQSPAGTSNAAFAVMRIARSCLFGWVRLCPFFPSSRNVSFLAMMTWASCPHGVRACGKKNSHGQSTSWSVDTVVAIGHAAFQGCYSLMTVKRMCQVNQPVTATM